MESDCLSLLLFTRFYGLLVVISRSQSLVAWLLFISPDSNILF
jgi:hypothetical protein